MAINRSKVQAQAQKYALKGQIDKAIKEYLSLLEDDPGDLKVCQKLGDLYAKKGDKKNACDHYGKIAKDYTDKGFYLKAIAVYKQVIRLVPDDAEIYIKLANLYQKQGLAGEAIAHYKGAAGRYEKDGKVHEALEVIGKMADLDPSNVAIRVKLAESFRKEGLHKKAVDEVVKAGEELRKQGKNEEIITLFEKSAKADQTNKELFKELARAYLDKDDEEKALENINQSLKIDPNDSDSLSMVAGLYKKRGNAEKSKLSLQHILRVDPASTETRKALFDIYKEEGDIERAISEYEMVIDLYLNNEAVEEAREAVNILKENFPDNVRVLGKICEIHCIFNDEENLVASYKELARLYFEKGDQEHSREICKRVLELRPDDEEALEWQGAEEGAERDVELQPEKGSPLSSSQVDKMMTEVEVYIKYGMVGKAEETLNEIIRRNLKNIGARLALKGIYVADGRTDDAINQLLAVAGAYKESGEDKNALASLKEILKLSPEHREALEMYSSISGEEPEVDEEAALEVEEIPLEIELEIDEDELPEVEEEETIELAEIVEEETLEEEAAEETAAPGKTELNISDIPEKLEEAEFYIQQELFDKARVVLNAIIEIEPENGVAAERLKNISSLEKSAKEAALEAKTPAGGEFADLTSELINDVEAAIGECGELMGFDSLIDSSQEVMAGDVSEEDSQTHYDLGIAYKEMGAYDDAVNEFMKAMNDEKKVFDAYCMVGLCYMDKGQPEEAIEYYCIALETEGISKEAEMNLNYELGIAYREAKMNEKAKKAFAKVYNADKTFRDVDLLFAELGGFGNKVETEELSGMETVSEKDIDDPDSKSKDKVSYI